MAKSNIEWTDILQKRFLENIKKTDTCWIWVAGLFQNGYGQFRMGAYKVKAHRAAFDLFKGKIPAGYIVCHTCDNPACVNPLHLFLGTHLLNAKDRDVKGRGLEGRLFRKPGQIGSKNHASKLTEQQVSEILIKRDSGQTYRKLSKDYNVSSSAIAQIVKGVKWQHVPR